MAYKVLVT